MEVVEFQRIVRLGLGRAVLHLREQSDTSHYHAVILDACLVNDVYDPQMNAIRGQYLFDLIQASDDTEYFRNRLIADLSEDHDEREYDVVPDIVGLFAKGGDPESRETLFAALDRNPISDPIDVAVVALDGLDGLLAVARRVGALEVGENLHPAVGDGALDEAIRLFGEDRVWESLESFAKRELVIAAYTSRQREWHEPLASTMKADVPSRPAELSYEEFVATVDRVIEDRKCGRKPPQWPLSAPVVWGQHAAEADVAKAAADLLAIPDEQEERLDQYLRVFWRRPFPLPHQRLLQLVDHRNRRIANWAINALRHVSHVDVRNLAFRLRTSPDWRRRRWIDLLSHNYNAGDHQAIEASILAETDEEALHSYGINLVDLQEAHGLPELAQSFLLLYDRAPCAFCREDIVKAYHRLERLPDWMIEECRFDSNLHLREFVASLN